MSESTRETVRAEGADVGRTAAEAGGQVAGTAADQARNVAGEARKQAKDLVGEARGRLQQQAGSTQRQAADGVRGVADQLRQMAGSGDGGPVADLAHEAADRAERLASWLQEREPGDLVEEVRRVARRRPGAFLAGAALAGVLVGRLTRGVVDHERDTSGSQPGLPADRGVGQGLPPGYGVAGEGLPGAPPVPPPPVSPGPTSTPPVPPGPGTIGQGGPPNAPTPPAGGPVVPPPHPAPEGGPAHAPRPGSTTVGEYVDELGRRGDPRVTDQDVR
ncbi:hypothetical protein ACFQH9_07325 [Pseudonocardia lutea]|uniref:Uncharacterized protein n=1 Tax=Pseudonocardia lutea TaxID=2172015 RepID=A0ABW1I379_9PSEU